MYKLKKAGKERTFGPFISADKVKGKTIYIPKKIFAKLESYREPNKPITTSIEKLFDIAERREFLVVAALIRRNRVKVLCNKMKATHQHNRVYCKMLETLVSVDYCMRKCPASPIVNELLEKSKCKHETGTVSLEKFLPPKVEHPRNPPKT